jgi:DNA-binding response OmpR family regulator
MGSIRILFVDDEPSLALTMPAILRQHGYEVTAAETVNEALAQILASPFDVLISDLNIGHPGDGFTVVSAMRRTNPACITLILTGYPGFDTALEAIRSQVDDYLVKPAPIPTLIDLIEQKLKNPRPGMAAATKRISQVLRENVFEITQRALKAMKADSALGALKIADEQRIEFVPRKLEQLATMLESSDAEQAMTEALHSTDLRGLKRYQQGYTVRLLVVYLRIVEQAIYDVIHEHLLSLNLSHFMLDLKRLNASLSLQLEHTLAAFLEAEQRIGHQPEEAGRQPSKSTSP